MVKDSVRPLTESCSSASTRISRDRVAVAYVELLRDLNQEDIYIYPRF